MSSGRSRKKPSNRRIGLLHPLPSDRMKRDPLRELSRVESIPRATPARIRLRIRSAASIEGSKEDDDLALGCLRGRRHLARREPVRDREGSDRGQRRLVGRSGLLPPLPVRPRRLVDRPGPRGAARVLEARGGVRIFTAMPRSREDAMGPDLRNSHPREGPGRQQAITDAACRSRRGESVSGNIPCLTSGNMTGKYHLQLPFLIRGAVGLGGVERSECPTQSPTQRRRGRDTLPWGGIEK